MWISKLSKDVPHGWRERLDIRAQVLDDVVLIAHQAFEVEGRCIEEQLARDLKKEGLGVQSGLGTLAQFGQYGGLGRRTWAA